MCEKEADKQDQMAAMPLSCPHFYDIEWCVEKPLEERQQSYVICPEIEKLVYELMKVLY